MKINLGSGLKRYDGFLNVDDDSNVNPDYLINLDDKNLRLPFDDNSVEEIKAYHILEHIGDGYIQLIKEIYRVGKNNCLIDIIVPHHQHDAFYDDPTHKRAITVGGMFLFSKKHNEQDIKSDGSSSHLALKYNVDFEITDFKYEYDSFYEQIIKNAFNLKAQNKLQPQDDLMIQRLLREATNVACNTLIKMKVIK